jgi:hypothetical protein
MVFKTIATTLLFLILAPASWAIDPDENGVFRLICPDLAKGTCFVIAQDGDTLYLGTAYHVVEVNGNSVHQGNAYTVENDLIKDIPKAKVVAVDFKADLAVLRTTTTRKFTILPLATVEGMKDVNKIGFAYRPSDKEVFGFGYANGDWMKTFGKLCFADKNQVYSNGISVPGQSGGPATLDNKIIGVISGGNEWYRDDQHPEVNVTWPTRLGSAKRLKEILDWAKTQK